MARKTINTPLRDSMKNTALADELYEGLMCGVLDWISAYHIDRTPSEDDWTAILGISMRKVKSTKQHLSDYEIIKWSNGKGRQTHKAENFANTIEAKQKAFASKLKELTFSQSRWDGMNARERAAYKRKVDTFVEHYASEDMNNQGHLIYEGYPRFSIKGRFKNWIPDKYGNAKDDIPMPEIPKGKNVVTFASQADLDAFVRNMVSKYGDKAWTDWKKNNDYKIK